MPSFNSGPDKEAFLRYLDDFDAVADPDKLLNELFDCVEPLPLHQVQSLGLPDRCHVSRCSSVAAGFLDFRLMECPNDSLKDGVIHGSCADVLPTLPSASVQTVFVDPPYNIGVDYGSGKKADQLDPSVYLAQMEEVAHQCCRVLNNAGSLWFLVPEQWADDFGVMLRELLPRRNRIIWRETFGQYHEHRFPSGHRHLFWHVKDAQRSPFNTEDIRVPSQRMLDGDKRAAGPRVPDDVWEIPRLVGNATERLQKHPCQLPEELLQRIILCSSGVGDRVLDPMSGTGTTLRVAQRLSRRYVGIEQQEHFVELIRDRLNKAYQTTLFDHWLARCQAVFVTLRGSRNGLAIRRI